LTAITGAPPALTVRTAAISRGHRRDRDIGDVSALAASIAADGLACPLVLTTTHRLVSGARRLEACTILGWTQVPAVTVTGIWEALELMEAELADPRHVEPLAKPLTVAEAMSLDLAMRELAWWPRAEMATGDPNLGNNRRKRIAEALGLNSTQYTKAREVWNAARGFREHLGKRTPVAPGVQECAEEIIPSIQAPRDIRGAWERFRDGQPRRALSFRADGRRPPQADTADQIQAGLDRLAGIVGALSATGPLPPRLPPSDLDTWDQEITEIIRGLKSLRGRIRRTRDNASS